MTLVQRYFVEQKYWDGDKITIRADAHHIIRVMRFEIGDSIICIAPNARVVKAKIIDINETKDSVSCHIVEEIEDNKELPVDVTIVQSLAKGNKLDLIVQKGTELGANQFVFYESERSVVKWSQKKVKNRLQRFEKIIKEASEQSGRVVLPHVTYTNDVFTYVKDYPESTKLLAYEEEVNKQSPSKLYKELSKTKFGEEILVSIGPEGGFSKAEVNKFLEAGFVPVRLGKRILRTETASLYALAAISYHMEEMKESK